MRTQAIALGLLLALAGCAPGPVVQAPAELKGTHGFVHVSLPKGGTAEVIRLKSLASGEEHRLQRQAEHGPTAYGLWVPAGEYHLAEILERSGAPYAPITVSRGQLTDLGGLVRIEIGGYESVLLPVRHAELAAELQKASTALQPHLAAGQPIEWRPSAPPMANRQSVQPSGFGLIVDLITEYDRHRNKPPLNVQLKQARTIDEFYRGAVATMPPQTDEPAGDASGNLYYGADLGQIRMRARDGQWSSLDTGTLQTITAVEVSGRALVAGTSRGEIRVSEDGRTWRRAAVVAEDESVVDIDRVGDRWIVVTARVTSQPAPPTAGGQFQTTDHVKVYSSTAADLGGLALLREIPLTDKVFLLRGMTPRGQGHGGTYYVSSVGELLKLDLATLQWSTAANPGHGLHGFHVAKSGLITAYRQQGVFSKLSLSTDQGASWRPAETPPYVFYDILFDAPDKGVATRFAMGAFSAAIEFLEYDAGQNKWQKTHEAPQGCVRLLRDADNMQRFCLTSGNSILNRVGGKWIVEAAVG
jgi:hypothetical protein